MKNQGARKALILVLTGTLLRVSLSAPSKGFTCFDMNEKTTIKPAMCGFFSFYSCLIVDVIFIELLRNSSPYKAKATSSTTS